MFGNQPALTWLPSPLFLEGSICFSFQINSLSNSVTFPSIDKIVASLNDNFNTVYCSRFHHPRVESITFEVSRFFDTSFFVFQVFDRGSVVCISQVTFLKVILYF